MDKSTKSGGENSGPKSLFSPYGIMANFYDNTVVDAKLRDKAKRAFFGL